MDCPFVVGQRVQCIRDGWYVKNLPTKVILPVVNHVYTIRDIQVLPVMASSGFLGFQPCLHFVEFVNPRLPGVLGVNEVAFYYQCFRPLNERPTDISIFQKQLRTTKKKAPIEPVKVPEKIDAV